MLRRFALLMGLLPLLLAGCASVAPLEQSQPLADEPFRLSTMDEGDAPIVSSESAQSEDMDGPLSITTCERTERNLTVDWRAKRYVCTHEERLAALQQAHKNGMVAYRYRYRPLVAPNASVETSFITPAVVRTIEPVQGGAQPVGFTVAPRTTPPVSRINDQPTVTDHGPAVDTQLFRVWFPRDQEVLGPKGIEKVRALIADVAGARQVTLQGLYESTEIHEAAEKERERFSVGRALSVRRIWEQAGMDQSKFKILHHDPSRSGRFVEITLDD